MVVAEVVLEPTLAVTLTCAGQLCGHVARRGTRHDMRTSIVLSGGVCDIVT